MKRKKIVNSMALFLCFVGGVFVSKLTSCNNQNCPPVPPGSFQKCYTCDTTPHCKIPFGDIKNMVLKYGTDRSTPVNVARSSQGTTFEDGRSIVFDLESLKQYICRMEHAVQTEGLSSAYNLAGLRFYFTVYPEQITGESTYLSGIDQSYRNKHSLLIVPTYLNGSQYIDYDPFRFAITTDGNGNNIKTPLDFSAIKLTEDVSIYDPLHPCNNGNNAMNHGSMCPPTCPTAPGTLLSALEGQ